MTKKGGLTLALGAREEEEEEESAAGRAADAEVAPPQWEIIFCRIRKKKKGK